MVEGVLLHKRNTHILVPPNSALAGFGLAAEHLDKCRLARAVRANHRHARIQRRLRHPAHISVINYVYT